jgi:histidyl-tRNA synthetase
MNGLKNFNRFQIADVYRRDNPAMTRGRFREFTQCDYDVAGDYSPMVADAEVISIVGLMLKELQITGYTIKINHRKLLDGLFAACGVPANKIRAISSSIDKLDKLPWEQVRSEMINDKSLPTECADAIGLWICRKGKGLQFLRDLRLKAQNDEMLQGIEDLIRMAEFLEIANGVINNSNSNSISISISHTHSHDHNHHDGTHNHEHSHDHNHQQSDTHTHQHSDNVTNDSNCNLSTNIVFDLSLARGLDYYTGMIFEVVLEGTHVGTFAAGGRYDKLVASLSDGRVDTPCVGASFGLERIFAVFTERQKQLCKVDGILVSVLRADNTDETMKYCVSVANKLRSAGISTNFRMQLKTRTIGDQITEALSDGARFGVIVGFSEYETQTVQLKLFSTRQQSKLNLSELIENINKLI